MSPIFGIYASQVTGHLWAPTGAYDAIASTTLSAGASSITFSSIPQTYNHLQIRLLVRSTNAATTDYFGLAYNGDINNTYYYYHYISGNGSSATSGSNNGVGSISIAGGTSTANIFTGGILDILDYSNTNKYKTGRMLAGTDYNGSGAIDLQSRFNFQNTNALTSFTFFTSSNFAVGSSFALYGIR